MVYSELTEKFEKVDEVTSSAKPLQIPNEGTVQRDYNKEEEQIPGEEAPKSFIKDPNLSGRNELESGINSTRPINCIAVEKGELIPPGDSPIPMIESHDFTLNNA